MIALRTSEKQILKGGKNIIYCTINDINELQKVCEKINGEIDLNEITRLNKINDNFIVVNKCIVMVDPDFRKKLSEKPVIGI